MGANSVRVRDLAHTEQGLTRTHGPEVIDVPSHAQLNVPSLRIEVCIHTFFLSNTSARPWTVVRVFLPVRCCKRICTKFDWKPPPISSSMSSPPTSLNGSAHSSRSFSAKVSCLEICRRYDLQKRNHNNVVELNINPEQHGNEKLRYCIPVSRSKSEDVQKNRILR